MSDLIGRNISAKLGAGEYVIRPLKFKHVYTLKDFLVNVLKEADELLDLGVVLKALSAENPTVEIEKIDGALAFIVAKAGEFFCIAIPGLSASVFDQDAPDDESPDIEQLLYAFDAILAVNHLSIVAKKLGRQALQPGQTATTTPLQP